MSAAFQPGGGWNQNARFAQVRAMVEEGRLWVDHFLVYKAFFGPKMERMRVENGAIAIPGDLSRGIARQSVRLAWRDPEGRLTPIAKPAPTPLVLLGNRPVRETERLVALETVAATGDVSFAGNHFYPNKPPGASLLAAPGYALLLGVERLAGRSPDLWWVLTVNAWLATAASVGLASAAGAVLVFGIARRFAGKGVALAVALSYAFGTMALPYGTVLFDQNLTAAALLAGFYFLLKAREGEGSGVAALAGFAGFLAGAAVVCNYLAGPVLLLLAFYAGRRVWMAFAAGTLAPLGFLAAYHQLCFGSPWALCSDFQNPLFLQQFAHYGPKLLGMFGLPRLDVTLMLLGSPFRGLFLLSPVLLLAAWGLWKWGRGGGRREAALCFGVFSFFFAVNASYAGWHGGYGVAPRYLGPAIPFLALGLVGLWPERPRLCTAAAFVSFLIQFALTATDPLSPVGTGSVARVDTRPDWLYSPLTEYAVPLLATGRAGPMLDAMSARFLARREEESGGDEAWLKGEIQRAVDAGEVYPFPLAAFSGPVSVNPTGLCEGDYFALFPPHGMQARWNAFNAGEFLWPGSRWSLLPVLAVTGFLTAAAIRLALRKEAGRARVPEEIFALRRSPGRLP